MYVVCELKGSSIIEIQFKLTFELRLDSCLQGFISMLLTMKREMMKKGF